MRLFYYQSNIYLIHIREGGGRSIKYRMMIIMGYLGAVIGAGFASGQEIVQFFVKYGDIGIYGTIWATVMFAACGARLLYLVHAQKASSHQAILKYLLGNRLGWILDALLAGFLFLGISTMLSASGAVFYEHLYLPKNLGVLLAYCTVMILLITGRKGLIYSYNFLVPVKLILMIIISGYIAFLVKGNSVEFPGIPMSRDNNWGWAISSVLYVSYNFSLAMVVLTQYQGLTSRRNGVIGAAWGGLALGGIVIIDYLALCKFLPVVTSYQVPMLYVAGQVNITAKHIYTIVLWLGIITTALANAYGFTQRVAEFTGLSYKGCLVVCMTMAVPLSMQSFASLVAKIYPVFGVLGVSIMAALVYRTTKDISTELYYKLMQLLHRLKEA